jgi:hypothetical protein
MHPYSDPADPADSDFSGFFDPSNCGGVHYFIIDDNLRPKNYNPGFSTLLDAP